MFSLSANVLSTHDSVVAHFEGYITDNDSFVNLSNYEILDYLLRISTINLLVPGFHMCGHPIFGYLYHNKDNAKFRLVSTCKDSDIIMFDQNFKRIIHRHFN